jgi:hypothetical protein
MALFADHIIAFYVVHTVCQMDQFPVPQMALSFLSSNDPVFFFRHRDIIAQIEQIC